MHILIAPDKFKHALHALDAAKAMREGVFSVLPDAIYELVPLADGGEGTLEALANLFPDMREVRVQNALGRDVSAQFALSSDGQSALIETAQANGLWRLSPTEYDPINASTYGVGQLILAALKADAKRIYLGLGGSATHDGGVGMAEALATKQAEVAQVDFIALCDVRSNLEDAITFASQKGAKPDDLPVLKQRLSDLAKQYTHVDPASEFTGAAGGLGFGCAAFLNARLMSGAHEILSLLDVQTKIRNADLVLTGEGSFDAQTASGKLIDELASQCKNAAKPLYVLAGKVDDRVKIDGITDIFNINDNNQANLSQTKARLSVATANALKHFRS